MNLNLFKSNLVLISGLVGFTAGSVSSSVYYQRQLTKERQTFLECQAAWEKYYFLNNQTNRTVHSQEENQTFWQAIKQEGLRMAQSKIEDSSKPFNKAQESYLVYHYEIVPKCSKLKDWEKYMNSLAKK